MTKPSKLLNQIIEESVKGKHEAWPLDPAYKAEGSYKDRYQDGDNQIVLWEIYRCAQEGSVIPDWAAKAFADLFLKVVTCELRWDQAFGKVPADGYYRTSILGLAKNLYKVGSAVHEYSTSTNERGKQRAKDDAMFSHLGKKLGLGRGRLKDFYKRYKSAHRS
jgi:hypothetical protein